MLGLLLAISSIFTSSVATNDDGYVYVEPDASCSSSNSCDGSLSNPYPSISEGLSNTGDTDILVLLDGTYTGPDNINITVKFKYRRITSLNGPLYAIIDCESNGYGLGFYAGTFYLSGITIQNCIATTREDSNSVNNNNYTLGGALWIESTYTEIIDCQFINNTAEIGAAIFFFSNSLVIESTNIDNNDALMRGGAIYIESAYLNLNKSTNITNNIAYYAGGAIYMRYTHIDSDIDSVLENNNVVSVDGNGNEIVCIDASASFYHNSQIAGYGETQEETIDALTAGDVVCIDCSLVLVEEGTDYCETIQSGAINNYNHASIAQFVVTMCIATLFLSFE